MEKVTDLFKSYRNKEIGYEELFGALTQMLSDDPHFSSQAIQALDSAQQFTPIPVTDFINLRGQLESTAETFQQQESFHTPADQEGTMVYVGEDATASPSDPTLMNNIPEPAPAPSPANNVAEEDYADEATVIMPMPPRQQAVAEPAPVTTPTAEVPEFDEHATIVAAPKEATPVPPQQPAAAIAETTLEPTPVPATEPVEAPLETPSAEVEVPSAKPAEKPRLPLLAIGSGAVILLAILLVVVLWPSADTDNQVADSISNEPTTQEITEAPEAPIETITPDTYIEPTTTELSDDATIDETLANEDTALPLDSSLETVEIDATETAEPEVKDAAYFSQAIEQAVANGNLSPAEKEGSATYFLVELIKLDPNSDAVTDARTIISKKHLELAKEARSNSQWDAAQQHLDDALKVRLPDSYLP